jgi:hypothetical protein
MGIMSQDTITIELAKDEALVLFEFLANLTDKTFKFDDQAEQRVLWNIQSELESALAEPFKPDYLEILKVARDKVRDKEE